MKSQLLRRERDEFYVAYKRMRTSYENAVEVMNDLHREISAQETEIRELRQARSAQDDQDVQDNQDDQDGQEDQDEPRQPQPYGTTIADLFGDTSSESSEDSDVPQMEDSSATDHAEGDESDVEEAEDHHAQQNLQVNSRSTPPLAVAREYGISREVSVSSHYGVGLCIAR
ncbi:hypothetical protein PHYSODRAFT_332330 [Phytophthora sojae]|uniref:Uncharacterized protein n=1 Tax=Phytophthora sojae (strain P6497) TaxID=1094619 RepID=G4ZGC9_PHYSP|nr:hypothetical protein PHYSODRAFT_332330 [Phytophthora sojae]EGZ18574.1 hypothetical protein PHYSODRAFT_332330 [Phytophthora sojae]|eukprot:XP_009527632.1 hypothetical protein PHYSODRAFT_332330 [Phytophthora sojae]